MLALIFALFSLAVSSRISDETSFADFTHEGFLGKHLKMRESLIVKDRPKEPIDFATGMEFKDHNGKNCQICGLPDPKRLAKGKKYTEFRTDCGESTMSGPLKSWRTLLLKRLNDFNKDAKDTANGLPMTAFCALNMQKSCADAIANEDYMYYAKGIFIPEDHAAKKYDFSYCLQNGWLDKKVVDLAHSGNFLEMQRYAKAQCLTRYEKYNWRKITFAKFGLRYIPGISLRGTASEFEANYIGAWNCAMGDAGCDMTYCAYTYCNLGDGRSRLYDECPGWDPINGMHR